MDENCENDSMTMMQRTCHWTCAYDVPNMLHDVPFTRPVRLTVTGVCFLRAEQMEWRERMNDMHAIRCLGKRVDVSWMKGRMSVHFEVEQDQLL